MHDNKILLIDFNKYSIGFLQIEIIYLQSSFFLCFVCLFADALFALVFTNILCAQYACKTANNLVSVSLFDPMNYVGIICDFDLRTACRKEM